MADFGMEQVTRYLRLLDRRMYIVMHSGIDWKPEYEQELNDIDSEISVLRELMDSAHGQEEIQDGVPQADSGQVTYQDYSNRKIGFFNRHGNDCNVYTSNITELGVYCKEYSFRDGAVWYERMSPVTESAVACLHGIRIPVEVRLFKTEFWDTDCSKSRYYYEKF